MIPGAGLSLEQAPPISVALRFYLGAPLFALAGALVLVGYGPDALASRWMPPALAATHLFVLGFFAQAMLGSLLQMLPVVAGAPVPRPRLVAGLVHGPLVLGAALLSIAFIVHVPAVMYGAMALLGAAFSVFVVAAALSLARAQAGYTTVNGLWLAVGALAVAVSLGILLAPVHVGGGSLAVGVRHLHPLWGLVGWIGLLVVSVAFQVVPMFQLTPPYAKSVQRVLLPALFLLLSLASLGDGQPSEPWLFGLLALGFVFFAALTTVLQHKRRRKLPDPSLAFWRIGLASLALSALLAALRPLLPLSWTVRAEIAATELFVVGFAWSVVCGMLVKIVPFLCWFHLQGALVVGVRVPHMGAFLPDRDVRKQLRAQLVTVPAVLLSIAVPWLHRPAWALLGAQAVYVAFLLLRATLRYRDAARAIAEATRVS